MKRSSLVLVLLAGLFAAAPAQAFFCGFFGGDFDFHVGGGSYWHPHYYGHHYHRYGYPYYGYGHPYAGLYNFHPYAYPRARYQPPVTTPEPAAK